MLANIVFVATGRTALVVIVVLLVVLAAKKLNARNIFILSASAILLGVVGWSMSPYLRQRTTDVWSEIQKYEATQQSTSSGERIEFWTKSFAFIRDAPLIGHGTGSIRRLFEQTVAGKTGAAAVASSNPHNQTFAVAIQLGLIGAAVLWAMWIAHLLLVRGSSLAEWIGVVIVVQNVVGSLFNSHLFDFVQGWVYVFGVGVAGGLALKHRSAGRTADAAPRSP
jgi:O-antigen ligase